ncbi:MAG: Response regulator SaeR [Candidatus Heimdallarchaeota archaeon LC_3]|nr:MAG: Response regulator SaeR [Candidatus Heimdallarchaeota archaeon LC_3]
MKKDIDRDQNHDIQNELTISVLHVDDDENFLEMTQIFIKKIDKPIRIDITTSPEKALYKLRETEYDIIISDYLMPNMNGLTLLKEIRKIDQEIPFVMLTGRGREEIAIEAINLGADYYLQKGIGIDSLFAELNNIIIKITQRKDALKAQSKAENILKLQQEEASLYLDVVTHDLNGYHLSAKTFLEISLDKHILSKDAEIIVHKAIKNIIRANTLLNTVTVLMQRKFDLNYDLQPVNVLMALERIKKDLLSIFPNRAIIIETGTIPPQINILADMLFDQVLLNLFTNAIKNDNHEEISILVSLDKNNKVCLLKISDFGRGILPERRKKLLLSSGEIDRDNIYSGVGLKIVKALMDRYRSQIWIEDRILGDYQQGTRITLKLHLTTDRLT